MKSVVMSVFLMSVSLGNLFTSGVNFLIQDAAGRSTLSGVEYYGFFAAVMLVTALGFVAVASRYEERTYLQKEG
jgi:POT family proton-dependent oligopeptide transporter